MPESQLSGSWKRQRSEQSPPQLKRASQPLSKRQHSSYQTPPAFWDNLSKLWLTKRALREQDRRIAQSASNTPSLIRHALTELKKDRQPTQFAPELLYNYSPRCLKDIKLFARHGGPNLTDLRGFSEPVNSFNHTMRSSKSRSRVEKRDSQSAVRTRITATTIIEQSAITESSGLYDCNFEQNLVDGGIYPDFYIDQDGRWKPQPNNWEEIRQRLAQPRRSLSPSKISTEAYAEFRFKDRFAYKEVDMMKTVIPIIEGTVKHPNCVTGGTPFGNLDQLTNVILTPGNPDRYYGARPEKLDRQVRIDLSGQIIPTTETKLPIVPNFFLAVNGPSGLPVVAQRQACYDGALGARGMHSLQSWGQDKPVYDNNAYVLTSTYSDGQLKMYTSHVNQPTGRWKKPEICTHQIAGSSMSDDVESFRKGALAYRNGIDWAREQRNDAIERANARAKDSRAAGTA